jgi:hypothetical protein
VNAGYGDTVIGVVGLPDAAVKESRDRVMTGPINSGFSFTFGRTVINLAPADVKKEGLSSIASAKEEPRFDLPIAIGIAAANERTEADQLEDFALCKGLTSFLHYSTERTSLCLAGRSSSRAPATARSSVRYPGARTGTKSKRGRDFLKADGHWDWAVRNPPLSRFREFLRRVVEVADNVVFIALAPAWFVRARQEDMRQARFALVELCALPVPPDWPQLGIELTADRACRG